VPYFSYKARDAGGNLIQGVVDGANAAAVADQLVGDGATPLEIAPSAAREAGEEGGVLAGLRGEKVTHVDMLLFSRQLHALLKAGVPITRALAGLQESATKAMGNVVRHVRESLESGHELSTSLARQQGIFSSFYVAMVRVGELTGRLDEIFLRLFFHLEFERLMRDQVRAALRYPTFVIAVMVVALAVINLFVIPAFAKVYEGFGAELPLVTRLLITFSNFMVAAWPYLLLGAAGAVFAFRSWTKTERGRYVWDRTKLRLPIAGKIALKATLARFARSFAMAMKSGVPIVQGMSVVATTVDNDFVARAVEKMREGIERGDSMLRTSMASGIFTPVVLQMIAVGEESGSLDEMLEEIADLYQRDVEYELKTLSAQIEPILIVMLGVLVLILALGVFLPIWDLGKAALKR
jgi:MSHA biogenesis protein MshG